MSVTGEICKLCGEPVALGCPSYWTTTDDVWLAVTGNPGTIRCIRCFTDEAEAKGIPIMWQARVDFDEWHARGNPWSS